jgi:2',3'-cyclic-nucleotide 2'-phosphodiesterase (5'-nucleotidase family)
VRRGGIAVVAGWLLAAAWLPAREVPLTILHTCDLHGHVLPTVDYAGRTNLGGLARCATMIRELRGSVTNALLVDAGDTLQGTAVSFYSDGLALVKALNHLRYDAWVWGNHEFDWGLTKLRVCAARAEMPILNANVSGDEPLANRLRPFLVRVVDGVRVGIIGLNTPGIPNWSRPRLIAGLRFADSLTTLREQVPAARKAGAQVLVLVAHQGYKDAGDDHANQINAIGRNYPELDVIIGGHTHQHLPEYKIANVLYCQAGYHGIHLGRVELVYDTDRTALTKRRSTTVFMDDRIALDRELLELLRPELDRAEKELAVVVGEVTGDFHLTGAARHETPVHNLIFDAIVSALRERGVAVDAVVHGILNRTGALAKGPVTVGDLWRVVPYENTIGVVEITAGQLREILEENVAGYNGPQFRGVWGLQWTFNPKLPRGERTVALRRGDGRELADGDRLRVAFNSYDLASAGLRLQKLREIADRPESQLREFDFQTREAVIEYVRRQKQIAPVIKGWWLTAAARARRPATTPPPPDVSDRDDSPQSSR